MKKKDLTLIIVVGIISAVISVLISSSLFSPGEKDLKAEKAEPITSGFDRPPSRYFNANSINPTQEIRIEEDENSNPFGPEQ